METTNTSSKAARITGLIIMIFVALFLLVDGIMKVAQAQVSMEGSVALGWPENHVQTIGVLLTIFTILYLIPRTAFIGAVLITAYLGGAVSVMMRIDIAYWFPVAFGILAWVGLALRDSRVKQLVF